MRLPDLAVRRPGRARAARWPRRGRALAGILASGAILRLVVLPASASSPIAVSLAGPNSYVQTNLVSDIPGVARRTDPNLVNPWGMSASPMSPVWISDNGTDVTTLEKGGITGSR